MKILNKIKDLFRKTVTPTYTPQEIPNPIGEIHYFDFKYDLPSSTKIKAQTIGLDLVEANTNPEITSGYYHFEIDEKEQFYKDLEKTIFEMKKVKRASEKVLEKMIETEKKFHKSLEYYKHKAEHENEEKPKIAKPKTKHVK